MKVSVAVLSLFLAASMAMPAPTQPNQIQPRLEFNNLNDLASQEGLTSVVTTLQKSVHIGGTESNTPGGPSTGGN
ncbi:hypothetical protein BDV37DRAFT_286365 [Aspergillus pseudonomiae]|uniref:Uncharacterized protein n=1 Tax=Aspergillus pseudonomiae TaxID=1506151 RepID=A0A5N7D2X5_9EURO|nr:uncharacterized protein BDV37DRAFT_286365 [Aspergillus pseudonomiae]KAE8400746.1 hypothetical protein BDV37DRAFT_286365 [Aspergillus pseudonomiae]